MTNSLTNSKLYQFLKKYQSETLKRKILKTKKKKDNINKRYLSYIKKGLEITDKIVILKKEFQYGVLKQIEYDGMIFKNLQAITKKYSSYTWNCINYRKKSGLSDNFKKYFLANITGIKNKENPDSFKFYFMEEHFALCSLEKIKSL